jgi:hypothetical protein
MISTAAHTKFSILVCTMCIRYLKKVPRISPLKLIGTVSDAG